MKLLSTALLALCITGQVACASVREANDELADTADATDLDIGLEFDAEAEANEISQLDDMEDEDEDDEGDDFSTEEDDVMGADDEEDILEDEVEEYTPLPGEEGYVIPDMPTTEITKMPDYATTCGAVAKRVNCGKHRNGATIKEEKECCKFDDECKDDSLPKCSISHCCTQGDAETDEEKEQKEMACDCDGAVVDSKCYDTLKEALKTSNYGETVYIGGEKWVDEPIYFRTKKLAVIGAKCNGKRARVYADFDSKTEAAFEFTGSEQTVIFQDLDIRGVDGKTASAIKGRGSETDSSDQLIDLTLRNVHITDMTCQRAGCGVFLGGAKSLYIDDDSVFKRLTMSTNDDDLYAGGAAVAVIYLPAESSLEIRGTYENNKASYLGGSIHSGGGAIYLDYMAGKVAIDGKFKDNIANQGGAINIQGVLSEANIDGLFLSNIAEDGGLAARAGAIRILEISHNGYLHMKGDYIGNLAQGRGGVIATNVQPEGSRLVIEGFYHANAASTYGAVWNFWSEQTIFNGNAFLYKGSTFEDNWSVRDNGTSQIVYIGGNPPKKENFIPNPTEKYDEVEWVKNGENTVIFEGTPTEAFIYQGSNTPRQYIRKGVNATELTSYAENYAKHIQDLVAMGLEEPVSEADVLETLRKAAADARFEYREMKADWREGNATIRAEERAENRTLRVAESFKNRTAKAEAKYDNYTIRADVRLAEGTELANLKHENETAIILERYEQGKIEADQRFSNDTAAAWAKYENRTAEVESEEFQAEMEQAAIEKFNAFSLLEEQKYNDAQKAVNEKYELRLQQHKEKLEANLQLADQKLEEDKSKAEDRYLSMEQNAEFKYDESAEGAEAKHEELVAAATDDYQYTADQVEADYARDTQAAKDKYDRDETAAYSYNDPTTAINNAAERRDDKIAQLDSRRADKLAQAATKRDTKIERADAQLAEKLASYQARKEQFGPAEETRRAESIAKAEANHQEKVQVYQQRYEDAIAADEERKPADMARAEERMSTNLENAEIRKTESIDRINTKKADIWAKAEEKKKIDLERAQERLDAKLVALEQRYQDNLVAADERKVARLAAVKQRKVDDLAKRDERVILDKTRRTLRREEALKNAELAHQADLDRIAADKAERMAIAEDERTAVLAGEQFIDPLAVAPAPAAPAPAAPAAPAPAAPAA